MAAVLAKIKIMPTSPEVNKEELKEKIKEVLEKQDVAIRGLFDEPLAFGLYAIYTVIEMEESSTVLVEYLLEAETKKS